MTHELDLPEVTTRLRPRLPMPEGFRFAATRCGIKAGRPDLGLIRSDPPAKAAGCFTQNAVRAPCVERNARLVPGEAVEAVLVNSGNANALTGGIGVETNAAVAAELAEVISSAPDSILTASTGVIGVPLPRDIIERALPGLVREQSGDPGDFAVAILTTDSTKVAHLEVRLPEHDQPIRILGIAKGSGMIHPDMATTLAFVCTDAAIDKDLLQELLSGIVDDTFNAITVDGDTSTNDMVIALANGASGQHVRGEPTLAAFRGALAAILDSLSQQVVRDGEGATRMLEVEVTGAPDRAAARAIARGICSSSLVKCSVFAGQPDFGRIAMAAGQAAHERGIEVSPEKLTISAQGTRLYSPAGPETANLGDVSRRLREPTVRWAVDLGQGRHSFVARGCDLSYDYVRINADEATQIEVSKDGAVTRQSSLGAYSPRLKHQLLVDGLAYVRRFTALKMMIYVPPNVGGRDLAENLAQDLELCLDAGLRPLVVVPSEAAAKTIHERVQAAGHFTSSVSPDPTRLSRLLDRGHLCVLVRPAPDPGRIVDLAIKVGIIKLLMLTNESGLRDNHGHVQRLSPENFQMGLERGRFEPTHADTLVLARHATTRGIPQLHLLDARVPHSVVGELFTTEGIGTLITRQALG